jgi:HlyD family secretion protein
MEKNRRKIIIRITLGLLIVAAIVYGFWPQAIPVQTATIERGPLQVIVEEEGETYVTDRYIITSPLTAHVRRISLKAGDLVEKGQALAQLDPPQPAILDSRTLAGASARVESAEAMLGQAETAANRAVNERDRIERLAAGGSATQQALDLAVADANQAIAARNTAQAELAAARAALGRGTAASSGSEIVRSPVSGRILAVHRQSEGHINPGEPIMEIGDTGNLEIRVEIRSQDAVRIQPGTRVIIDQWGGEHELEAVVRRVEPQGFTVISALGVEEKRVLVVSDFVTTAEERESLGSGFRVLTRFVIWEDKDVLQVPTGALFRTGNGWGVFTAENGTAVMKEVTLGHRAGLAAQVISGLSEGDIVITHPDNAIADGVRIRTD